MPGCRAKLRVEADESLLKQGDGQLYLGLFLDPLYEVHWNNHVGAPEVEITVRQTEVTPDRLRGPAVEEPSDADPREFLVAVKDGQPGETIFEPEKQDRNQPGKQQGSTESNGHRNDMTQGKRV